MYCIIILGTGYNKLTLEPLANLKSRLDKAIDVYLILSKLGKVKIILSGGSVNTEYACSRAMRLYLNKFIPDDEIVDGSPANKLLIEEDYSLNTIENIIYSKVI